MSNPFWAGNYDDIVDDVGKVQKKHCVDKSGNASSM